jgi:hypothetical protein
MTLKLAIVSQAERETVGTQDRTVSGLGTPIAAVDQSAHSDLNTFQGSCRYSAGMYDGTSQYNISSKVVNAAVSDTGAQQHIGITGTFSARLNAATSALISENTASFITDGIQLSQNPASSARVSTQWLMSGTSASVEVKAITENQTEGSFTDITIAEIPSFIIVMTTSDDLTEGGPHEGFYSINQCFVGVADSGATITYAGQAVSMRRVSTAEDTIRVYNDAIYTLDRTAGGEPSATDGKFTISFPDSTTLRLTTVDRTNDAAAAEFAMMLVTLDPGIEYSIGIADIDTTTGNKVVDLGMTGTPQFVQFLVNRATVVSTGTDFITGADAGVSGSAIAAVPIGLSPSVTSRCMTVMNESGVSTNNSNTYTSSKLIDVYPHTSGATGRIQATLNSFVAGGVSVNMTAAPSATLKWPYLAIQEDLTPPTITQSPVDAVLDAGDTLLLQSDATDYLSLEWYQNGVATGVTTQDINRAATASDGGQWFARYANADGTRDTNTATISIKKTGISDYRVEFTGTDPVTDTSNLELFITAANLDNPSAFWAAVANGGGNIRLTSDYLGTQDIPLHVDTCDTSTEELLIAGFKSEYTTADRKITLFVLTDTGATQPAAGSPYGLEAVYQDWDFYTLDGVTDLTGNSTLTAFGSPTVGTNSLGGSAISLNGSTQYIRLDGFSATYPAGFPIYFMSYANLDTAASGAIIGAYQSTSANQYEVQFSNSVNWVTQERFGGTFGSAIGDATVTSTWTFLESEFLSNNNRSIIVNDGTPTTNTTLISSSRSFNRLTIGRFDDSTPNGYFDGLLSFVGYKAAERNDLKSSLRHTNITAPTTFWTTGTADNPSAGGGIVVSESISSLTLASLDPVITLTSTLFIAESINSIELLSFDPSVVLTPENTITVSETSATLTLLSLDSSITLSAGISIAESTKNIAFVGRDPLIGEQTYLNSFFGYVKINSFFGYVKTNSFSGTIKTLLDFSGFNRT